MKSRREYREDPASSSPAVAPAAAGERLAADALTILHANGAESERTQARADQLSASLSDRR